jgi:hypothetical protein
MPVAAQDLGLALHELAVNASKYGAVTVPTCTIEIPRSARLHGQSHRRPEHLVGLRPCIVELDLPDRRRRHEAHPPGDDLDEKRANIAPEALLVPYVEGVEERTASRRCSASGASGTMIS